MPQRIMKYPEAGYKILHRLSQRGEKGYLRGKLSEQSAKAGYTTSEFRDAIQKLEAGGLILSQKFWRPQGGPRPTVYWITDKGHRELEAYSKAVEKAIQKAAR